MICEAVVSGNAKSDSLTLTEQRGISTDTLVKAKLVYAIEEKWLKTLIFLVAILDGQRGLRQEIGHELRYFRLETEQTIQGKLACRLFGEFCPGVFRFGISGGGQG
jgi:hypothetical protein